MKFKVTMVLLVLIFAVVTATIGESDASESEQRQAILTFIKIAVRHF